MADDKKGADLTPDQEKAKQAEAAAYADAQAATQKALAQAGTSQAPLAPHELCQAGEETVLCNFPRRVPLTLDASHAHRRVDFPAGTYAIPRWLATDYPRKKPGDKEATPGMHFYLAAHGVTVVEAAKPKK